MGCPESTNEKWRNFQSRGAWPYLPGATGPFLTVAGSHLLRFDIHEAVTFPKVQYQNSDNTIRMAQSGRQLAASSPAARAK
jgi:hypothetical protein